MGGFMGGRAAADASKNYAGRWTAVLVIGTLSSMGMGWSYGYDLGITGGVTGMKVGRFREGGGASSRWRWRRLGGSDGSGGAVVCALMCFLR